MDLIDNSLINIRSCRSKEYCEKFESHDPKGCKDAVSDSDGPRPPDLFIHEIQRVMILYKAVSDPT